MTPNMTSSSFSVHSLQNSSSSTSFWENFRPKSPPSIFPHSQTPESFHSESHSSPLLHPFHIVPDSFDDAHKPQEGAESPPSFLSNRKVLCDISPTHSHPSENPSDPPCSFSTTSAVYFPDCKIHSDCDLIEKASSASSHAGELADVDGFSERESDQVIGELIASSDDESDERGEPGEFFYASQIDEPQQCGYVQTADQVEDSENFAALNENLNPFPLNSLDEFSGSSSAKETLSYCFAHAQQVSILLMCSLLNSANPFPAPKSTISDIFHGSFQRWCMFGGLATLWMSCFSCHQKGILFFVHNTLTSCLQIIFQIFCQHLDEIKIFPQDSRVHTLLQSNPNSYGCFSAQDPHLVELDSSSKTRNLLLSSDRLEIRNESWTFESIRATCGVPSGQSHASPEPETQPETEPETQDEPRDPLPKIWYFEVEIFTDGIIQIGWSSPDCIFDPERGSGVGDDYHSYAYDGARRRAWHGPLSSGEYVVYGSEWSPGDIISCLYDVDQGSLSFWLNGHDLGVAFKNVASDRIWYPSVSLASQQHCRFRFLPHDLKYFDASKFTSFADSSCFPNPTLLAHLPTWASLEHELPVPESMTYFPNSEVPILPVLYYELSILSELAAGTQLGFRKGGVSFMLEMMDSTTLMFSLLHHQDTKIISSSASILHKFVWSLSHKDQSLVASTASSDAHQLVLGCGFDKHSSGLFFTYNGIILDSPYSLIRPFFDPDLSPLSTNPADFSQQFLPLFWSIRGSVNFGQSPFLFSSANLFSSRLETVKHLRELFRQLSLFAGHEKVAAESKDACFSETH
eukprot:Sdes_comp17390_c0_seq1m6599